MSNASTATHALGTNSISFFEKSVIQDARRKLLQSSQNLLSAIDLSNSPQSLQMTPDNRRVGFGGGGLEDSGHKSIITVSSLVKTPQSNRFMSLNNQYHQNMNFAEIESPIGRYNLHGSNNSRRKIRAIDCLFESN